GGLDLTLRALRRVLLGLLPGPLDRGLSVLGGELGLQTLTLEGGVLLRRFEVGLGPTLLRLGLPPCRVNLGLGLRLLEAPLACKVVVADEGPCHFLGLAGDLADEPPGRLPVTWDRSSARLLSNRGGHRHVWSREAEPFVPGTE